MKVALLAFDGFNELDLFANYHVISRSARVTPDTPLQTFIASARPVVTSMYGVAIHADRDLGFAQIADVVLVSSGGTQRALEDPDVLSLLKVDASRQLIGSQCSGALLLEKLGLLAGREACIDSTYRSHLEATGVSIVDQPFCVAGNVATAAGCFASAHLSAWVLTRCLGAAVAASVLSSVAPVGEEEAFVRKIMQVIGAGRSNAMRPDA